MGVIEVERILFAALTALCRCVVLNVNVVLSEITWHSQLVVVKIDLTQMMDYSSSSRAPPLSLLEESVCVCICVGVCFCILITSIPITNKLESTLWA